MNSRQLRPILATVWLTVVLSLSALSQEAAPPAGPPTPGLPKLTDVAFPAAGPLTPGAQTMVDLIGENLKGSNGQPTIMVNDPAVSFIIGAITDTRISGVLKIDQSVAGNFKISVKTDQGVSEQVQVAILGGGTESCVDVHGYHTCSLFRWQIDTNAATTNTTTSNTQTSPDVMVGLDYQVNSTLTDTTKGSAVFRNLTNHIMFKTGIGQITTADKVQPVSNGGSSNVPASSSTTAPCPGTPAGATATPAPATGCQALTPHQAFVADIGATLGWEVGRDGQGRFAEAGIKARGSLQVILPGDQVLQQGGNFYSDLGSVNLRNAVGLYEMVGRFRVAQHDPGNAGTNYTSNPEDLLRFEIGYQNNSGMQHLVTSNPALNTRQRFVGRFVLSPEINTTTHTRIQIGIEYNAGINGGPRDIKFIYGGALDAAALLRTLANK
jgi:hypothetical protein